jgi:hypothetical protein
VVEVMSVASNFVTELVGWGLSQVGLSQLIGAGAIVTVGMYLWWGMKLHVYAGVVKSVGISVAKTGGIAVVLALALLGWLAWQGVIPSIRFGVLVDTVADLLGGVLP